MFISALFMSNLNYNRNKIINNKKKTKNTKKRTKIKILFNKLIFLAIKIAMSWFASWITNVSLWSSNVVYFTCELPEIFINPRIHVNLVLNPWFNPMTFPFFEVLSVELLINTSVSMFCLNTQLISKLCLKYFLIIFSSNLQPPLYLSVNIRLFLFLLFPSGFWHTIHSYTWL